MTAAMSIRLFATDTYAGLYLSVFHSLGSDRQLKLSMTLIM